MTPLLHVFLEASIRISLVVLVVWLALLAGRVRSGSLRHIAWLVVLCAMPLMPMLPHVVPDIKIPISSAPTALKPTPLITEPAGMAIASTPSPSIAHLSENFRAQEPSLPETRMPAWPNAILAIYASGVLVLLWRCLSGWLVTRRILRQSRKVNIGNLPVYESDLLCAPVTMGLWTRKILLPKEWREWPEDKLRAVLAHESAHVRRGDTITGMLAHLNRCFFWFHPLAWWLERQLAISAEQACDDAGVRAIGENRRYAQVLLDMAEAVRRRGSLLSFHSAGVYGTGLLGMRIDRILHESSFSQASGIRKALVVLGCATAIFLIAACQKNDMYTRELKPDPKLAILHSKDKEDIAAQNMGAAQAAQLEAAVKQNPNDFDTRRKLMIYYQSCGRTGVGNAQITQNFWAHKLWFIEHYPEHGIAAMDAPLWDAAGHEKAKKLWFAYIERKDAPLGALLQAAEFFREEDPPLAEKLLLRVQAARPKISWISQFSSLYSSTLAKTGAQGAFAQEVRKKLDGTKDSLLLAVVGSDLARGKWGSNPEGIALGKSYLERALQLNPQCMPAQNGLAYIQRMQESERMRQLVKPEVSEAQYKMVSELPEAERFQFLPSLAQNAYIKGNIKEYYKHDAPGARQDWAFARRYAQDALSLAPQFSKDSNYRKAMFSANMVLGMVAMVVDGDIKAATKYLLAASKTPAADISMAFFIQRLPTALLKHGGPEQRKAVIEYLERCGPIFMSHGLIGPKDAEKLRAGNMPAFYQVNQENLK
jgi:beta-lactamase regulating signal transducer with metallopeptidase domain